MVTFKAISTGSSFLRNKKTGLVCVAPRPTGGGFR